MIVISIVLGALGLIAGLSALVYSIHVAVVYDTFNLGIKKWSESLDASTREAIDRSARQILRELDEKISSSKMEGSDENVDSNLNDLSDE